MKEVIFLSLCSVFLLSGGCKKKHGNERRQPVEQISSISIKIEPDSVQDWDIDSIYAVILTPIMGKREVVLGKSAYNNRKFEITIPAVLENNYLGNPQKVLLTNSQSEEVPVQVSDSTASLSWSIKFNAYKDGDFVGNLIYMRDEPDGLCQGYFHYANSSFSFSGYYKDFYYLSDYDVEFETGWNLVSRSFIYKKMPVSDYLKSLDNPDEFQWRFWSKDAINPS